MGEGWQAHTGAHPFHKSEGHEAFGNEIGSQNENPAMKQLLYSDFSTQDAFKKEKGIGIESLFLYIDTNCDNNCIICRKKIKKNSNISIIEKKLSKNLFLKKKKISLIGNDVLIHENIKQILELCKKYGFKEVEIMTSGHRLSDNHFVKDLGDIGINIIFSLPLFSAKSSLHDKITQNLGSFNMVISGLKNIEK